MLVDVIRMRSEGVKLSKETLRRATPVRGHLLVRTYRNECVYPNQPPTCTDASLSALAPGKGDCPLPYLRDALQKPGRGCQFVVVGREPYGDPSARLTYPQAWWCAIVRTTPSRSHHQRWNRQRPAQPEASGSCRSGKVSS